MVISKTKTTFVLKIKKVEEIRLDCECHNEIFSMTIIDEENVFAVSVYKYASVRYSLWRRIRFLFSGVVEYNEVILSAENASKLADFINNRINTINHEQE